MIEQNVRPDINHYDVIDKACEITGCPVISKNAVYRDCYNMYGSLENFILDKQYYVLFIEKKEGLILHVVDGLITDRSILFSL
jgi:hypothetical protein